MYFDTTFTNGVIKSREKYLLGEKIERMADGSLQDAFRTLKESGLAEILRWSLLRIARLSLGRKNNR